MKLVPILSQLTIATKAQGLQPFRPNSSQLAVVRAVEEQFRARRPVRVIVLKARQVGISTVCQAIQFAWLFMIRPTAALTLAHNAEVARHLLEITQRYERYFPFRELSLPRYRTRNELTWDFGSSVSIHTAKSTDAIRGRTIQALHGSEVAFWPNPQGLMAGMRQSIPNTHGSIITLESTANGVGDYFYDTWNAAVSGDSEFEPVFIPWFRHAEYGLKVFEPLGTLTAEERALRKGFKVTDEQLAWRRWAIQNLTGGDEIVFAQEYPATPEEAFIQSGQNIFKLPDLQAVMETAPAARGYLERMGSGTPKFVADSSGPLKVYRRPSSRHDLGNYIVSGDPTFTTKGDPAVIQVLNRVTYEQVAVWEQHIDPISFAEELAKMALWYNNALVTCEIEGPGYATVGRLSEIYPRVWRHQWADKMPGSRHGNTYGWSTNWKRKEWSVGWLKKLIKDRTLVLHDQRTFEQLRNYGLTAKGMANLDPNGHDDHVMSLAIGIICSITDGPFLTALPGGKELGLKGLAREALDELGYGPDEGLDVG
jgi:hypothetical protein